MTAHAETAARSMRPPISLTGRERGLDLSEPAIMGIVNVTPDSFSDGGLYLDTAAAIERGLAMVDDGARIVDIGGESTRPRSSPVATATECERVLPVIEGLRAHSDCFISIDTTKPEVMAAALATGADMVNDVMALRRPGALETVADHGAAACLMHMQGEPATMQNDPRYTDVVAEVGEFLRERVIACRDAGIAGCRLCIDPGFGFGKTWAHNLALLRGLAAFAGSEQALMIGVSRKSMLARVADHDDRRARVNGGLAAAIWAIGQGARIIRTHDVRDTRDVMLFGQAMAGQP